MSKQVNSFVKESEYLNRIALHSNNLPRHMTPLIKKKVINLFSCKQLGAVQH